MSSDPDDNDGTFDVSENLSEDADRSHLGRKERALAAVKQRRYTPIHTRFDGDSLINRVSPTSVSLSISLYAKTAKEILGRRNKDARVTRDDALVRTSGTDGRKAANGPETPY